MKKKQMFSRKTKREMKKLVEQVPMVVACVVTAALAIVCVLAK